MANMIHFYRDVLGFEIKEVENTDNVYLVKDGTLSYFPKNTPTSKGGEMNWS